MFPVHGTRSGQCAIHSGPPALCGHICFLSIKFQRLNKGNCFLMGGRRVRGWGVGRRCGVR